MSNGSRINAPRLVVGFGFLLLGVFLFLDRVGVVDFAQALAYWPLLLVLLGLSLMIEASRAPGTGRSDFPAGSLIFLVLITLVAGRVLDSSGAGAGPEALPDVRLTAIMSGRRAAVTDVFRAADLTSVMGGTVLDLRQATIPPGETGIVDLFTVMGGAVLYVPPHWEVNVESTVVMGGVKDERNEPPEEDRERRRSRGRRESTEAGEDADTGSAQGDRALPGLPEAPRVPEVPGVPVPPDFAEPSAAPSTTVREDTAVASASSPPRVVVRGFLVMGGVTIKP